MPEIVKKATYGDVSALRGQLVKNIEMWAEVFSKRLDFPKEDLVSMAKAALENIGDYELKIMAVSEPWPRIHIDEFLPNIGTPDPQAAPATAPTKSRGKQLKNVAVARLKPKSDDGEDIEDEEDDMAGQAEAELIVLSKDEADKAGDYGDDMGEDDEEEEEEESYSDDHIQVGDRVRLNSNPEVVLASFSDLRFNLTEKVVSMCGGTYEVLESLNDGEVIVVRATGRTWHFVHSVVERVKAQTDRQRDRFSDSGFRPWRLCRFYYRNRCRKGAECDFAHSLNELHRDVNPRDDDLFFQYR